MSADKWAVCPLCQADTFREDWEIGLLEGTPEVFISYSGRCTTCHASAHQRTTLVVEPA